MKGMDNSAGPAKPYNWENDLQESHPPRIVNVSPVVSNRPHSQSVLPFVQAGLAAGATRDREVEYETIGRDALVANFFHSLPAVIANKSTIVAIQFPQSPQSVGTTAGGYLKYFAAMGLGVVSEAVIPLISEQAAKKDQREINDKLLKIKGLALPGEHPIEALQRHTTNLSQEIIQGKFNHDPEKLIQAFGTLCKAYIAGFGSMYSRADLHPNGLGSGAPQTMWTPGSLLLQPARYEKATKLLEVFEQNFGVQARAGTPLSDEQKYALGFLKTTIEAPLLRQRGNPDARTYLEEIYPDLIDAIEPGSSQDLLSRVEALEQCEKLFSSNVPPSRLQQGINKIREKLGLSSPRVDLTTDSRGRDFLS